MVFTIIAIPTFYITGINCLPSVLRTDDVQDLLFRSPYDALFHVNEATALFVFDDLSIFEGCIHNPDRILRTSPS